MKANEKESPVGGNQVARAFAWKAPEYLRTNGEIALFMPAMTLFESPAKSFRRSFFQRFRVHTIANFSNLAEVLSGGRFRVPAASFFYKQRQLDDNDIAADEAIRVYSPLVANQEPTRPEESGHRNETWSIVVNASEIRDISYQQVADGNELPWKLATWGSQLDSRLLNRLAQKFPSLYKLERTGVFVVAEGPALVDATVAEGPSKTRPEPDVVGKKTLNVKELAKLRHVFAFPDSALSDNTKVNSNLHRGRRGVEVCKAPHVIVSAARIFAVYSDAYLVIPPRQIGISNAKSDDAILKCLSLFLSSDFAFYHQFFTSSQLGAKRDVATLDALRRIPIPIMQLSKSQVSDWVHLHAQLAKQSPTKTTQSRETKSQRTFAGKPLQQLPELLNQLNSIVSSALGLDENERALIDDFVHVRWELNDGKVGDAAVRVPSQRELREYADLLKRELDSFVGDTLPKRHQVQVVFDSLSGMVCVDFTKRTDDAKKIDVLKANEAESKQLLQARERLRSQRAQWVYFDRNLRIYEGTKTYVFKPMQRFHWTRTQALLDAREIISETLSPVGAR